MISAGLLTTLKIALPVGAVATMGGTVYFASSYLPKRMGSSNDVYLVVAGKEVNTTSAGALASIDSGKATKNYVCEVDLEGDKKLTDKDCSLFNLNASTTDADKFKHIDFNENMFSNTLLTQTADSVKTTSKHILKLSKSFYDKYSKVSTTDKKQIKLRHKSEASKHFGAVEEEFNLGISKATSSIEYSTNLFLARVETKGSASGQTTEPLSCKLSATKTVDCKIYKIGTTNKEKTNDHDFTSLSNLSAINLATAADYEAGKYIVVELINEKIKPSELHNKQLTINKKPATSTTPAEGDKVADIYFDQVLLGKVGTSPATSTIYPLTAKTETYVVKKGTVTNFADIKSSSEKNYKCKFTTTDNKNNYDNSCVLKTFPAEPKVHEYSSMMPTSTSFNAITDSTNNKVHFLLTVDKNKLFNLNPDWSTPTSVKVVAIVEGDDEAKKAEFNIEHVIKPNKAEGKVKLALVKYKAKEELTETPSPEANKCFFSVDGSGAFACSLQKTKPSTPTPATPYKDVEFDTTAATAFAETDHFALLISDSTKDFTDFESNVIYAHLTESTKTSKYTFDVIALMGGEVDSGKIAYFLEAPRTPPAQQK